jgi:hypothetical protein
MKRIFINLILFFFVSHTINMSTTAPASATPAGAMTPTPSAPTQSQIPDLMKIGAIPINVNQDVETDILDPVVQNEKFIRFQLQNKGILHSHSKIQFSLECANQAYLPLNVGIASLIQRATLKVGNKTICEVDDFGHFQAYRSMFMSSESMRERLMYQSGQCISHEFAYDNEGDLTGESSTAIGGGGSDFQARGIGIDTGMNYEVNNDRAADIDSYDGLQLLTPQGFLQLDNRYSAANAHPVPTFQMSLSDLFPFLKINQLPLYMMREAIQLEFVLSTQGIAGVSSTQRSFVDADSAAAAGDVETTLVVAKTRMIADYIYFPQEMMVAYANANKKLQFTYVDYRLSKHTFDAATTTGTQIRNIGGAGRVVSKIVWGMCQNGRDEDALMGNYNAQAPERDYAGAYLVDSNGTTTLNVKVNDNFVYPIDVDNTARHFHNVVQAEQLVPYVNREEYGNEGESITGRSLLGYTQDDQTNGLSGRFFWNATRFLSGERVNSRGIELYYDYATLPTTAAFHTQRCWLELVRYAVIEDGITSCYYA